MYTYIQYVGSVPYSVYEPVSIGSMYYCSNKTCYNYNHTFLQVQNEKIKYFGNTPLNKLK